MKILKNFKLTGDVVDEEYPVIKLLDQEDIFAELPLCLAEFSVFYKAPVLFSQGKGLPQVIEKEDLITKISTLKRFYFSVDTKTGFVKEVSKEESNFSARLPKDTPIDQLVFKDGEIFLVESVEEVEKETEETKGD